MSTFAQETTHDLKLEQGQLVLVTDPAECAAIELRNKFKFVKGEWFLDTRQGVPYFGLVFVKNPNLQLVRSLFRKIILSAQTVTRVLELATAFNARTRVLQLSFRALTSSGKVITGGFGKPFVVEG